MNTEIWTQWTPIKINKPASSLFTKLTPISKLETHQSKLETQNQIQFGDTKFSNHQNINPANQTLKKAEITYKQLSTFHTNNKPRIFKETTTILTNTKPKNFKHKPRKSNTRTQENQTQNTRAQTQKIKHNSHSNLNKIPTKPLTQHTSNSLC